MENNLNIPDLTKWPRLLVTGEAVSREQANEILIRTANWDYMHSNDKAWTRIVNALAGIDLDEHSWPVWESAKEFRRQMRVLDLEYLYNAQIASSWIGGPHGWCDWDGQIGCTSYNIGKWPTIEDVVDEWKMIAGAFPYLNLRAQLIPEEGEGRPAVEFRISAFDPIVEVIARPDELILPVQEAQSLACLVPGGERGVSVERLQEALEQVRGTTS